MPQQRKVKKYPPKKVNQGKARRRRFKPVAARIERALATTTARLPKVMVKARQHLVLEMYATGKTIDQIALKLKLPRQIITRDLNTAIQEMIETFAKPTPQQSFVRYATFQLSVIRKLTEAVQAFKQDDTNRQYNAWVSALRAQSDIYDKVYAKGVEYGVIQADKADPKSLQGSHDIRQELKAEIQILATLLDHIDDQTQRDALRGRAIQAKIKYAVRVRKPITTPFGIARAIADWKYRQHVYDHQGNAIPIDQLTPEQRHLLPHPDPDAKLHAELLRHTRDSPESNTQTSPAELAPQDSPEPTQEQPQQPDPRQQQSTSWIVRPSRIA